MDYETFKQAVEEAKREQPYLFDEKMIEEFDWREAPASDENIRVVEQELGAKLPEDYVKFLKEYGGGDFGYQSIFSAQPDGYWYILKHQQWVFAPHEKFIAFSENGCGDYYGFRVVDGVCEPTVVFCDHELGGEVTPTSDGPLDFLDFVVKYGLQRWE